MAIFTVAGRRIARPDRGPAATDPAPAAEVAEVRARLVRAIRGFGEKERVVTTFYYFEGLTLREIGQVLDLTGGRISQILHAALDRLRHSLDEEGMVYERAACDR